MFGSKSPLGQPSSSPFGAQPAFGQTNTANTNNSLASKPFGSTSPFGSQTGGSLFGGTATCVFAAAQPPSSTLAWGSSSTPAFGTSSVPTFGSTSTSFGASSTSAFGSTSTPFGTTSPLVIRSPFGGFGSPNPTQSCPFSQTQPTFKSQPFDANINPTFGATSMPAFSSTLTPSFGASSAPTFGASSSIPFFGFDSTSKYPYLGDLDTILARLDEVTTKRDCLRLELEAMRVERDMVVVERDRLQTQLEAERAQGNVSRGDRMAIAVLERQLRQVQQDAQYYAGQASYYHGMLITHAPGAIVTPYSQVASQQSHSQGMMGPSQSVSIRQPQGEGSLGCEEQEESNNEPREDPP